MYMYPLVVFSITGTLFFLTLNSSSTVSSGDDNYGGPVSTGGAFEFGNSYIYNVYVSSIQTDTRVHRTICSCKLHIHLQAYPCSCVLYPITSHVHDSRLPTSTV